MLRLVKTVGGSDGSPHKCHGCRTSNFIKAGIAWHCAECGIYFPAELKNPIDHLKQNLDQLATLRLKLKEELKNLEDLGWR